MRKKYDFIFRFPFVTVRFQFWVLYSALHFGHVSIYTLVDLVRHHIAAYGFTTLA